MKTVKAIFVAGVILLLTSCGNNDGIGINKPCIPTDVVGSVIAFYPFTNGTLNDISGNGNHLSNSTEASPTMDREENPNSAFEFDNSTNLSEFLTTRNTGFLNNLDEFSISLWYKPMSTSRASNDYETLISRDLGRSCPYKQGQWSIALADCRRAVFGRTNAVWDFPTPELSCKEEIDSRTNNWSHLVATFSETGISMSIYRDGVLQENKKGNGTCQSGNPIIDDIGYLYLGKGYTGKIDDLMIFNRVLLPVEVQELFNMNACLLE